MILSKLFPKLHGCSLGGTPVFCHFLMILKIAISEAETSIIVGSIRTILDIPHSSCTVAHWGTAGHGVGSLKTYPFMAGGLDSAANTIATCLYL